jgi:hypothetical protein
VFSALLGEGDTAVVGVGNFGTDTESYLSLPFGSISVLALLKIIQ